MNGDTLSKSRHKNTSEQVDHIKSNQDFSERNYYSTRNWSQGTAGSGCGMFLFYDIKPEFPCKKMPKRIDSPWIRTNPGKKQLPGEQRFKRVRLIPAMYYVPANRNRRSGIVRYVTSNTGPMYLPVPVICARRVITSSMMMTMMTEIFYRGLWVYPSGPQLPDCCIDTLPGQKLMVHGSRIQTGL